MMNAYYIKGNCCYELDKYKIAKKEWKKCIEYNSSWYMVLSEQIAKCESGLANERKGGI